MIPPRSQQIFAIRRKGKWYAKREGWTDQIERAAIYPRKNCERIIRIDIGMACEIVEIVPQLIEGSQPEVIK